jgi:hypothetical protein
MNQGGDVWEDTGYGGARDMPRVKPVVTKIRVRLKDGPAKGAEYEIQEDIARGMIQDGKAEEVVKREPGEEG